MSPRTALRLLVYLLMAGIALMPVLVSAAGKGSYKETKLVSDMSGVANFTDPNLKNAWGMSHSATSPWWVSDNATGVSTLYNGNGVARPLVVSIPMPDGTPGGTPTGQVFNEAASANASEFQVSATGKTPAASLFIFATEDGTISGWNPAVDGTNAIIEVNRSAVGAGAVYKGLTMGQSGGHDFLYAANFRFGTVEMFNSNWQLAGSFTDRKLAATCPLPGQCYAPFGIQNIGGKLYVTFALQDATKHDDVAGKGNGWVDVFNTNGTFVSRLTGHGPLNSPWGLALAPANFGRFSGDLLVGNFGDGLINAFDPKNGRSLGPLADQSGQPIVIDGLWGIAFGNGAAAGGTNELFFASGPNDESDGLFGKIGATAP